MKKLVTVSSLCALLLLGCSYGFSIRSDITQINNTVYEPHNRKIDIFFEDLKPDKAFTQIALIEVKGGRGYQESASNTLLKILEEKARKLGADAVMNIQVRPMTRDGGYLFDDEDDELYSTNFMTGIAIKYKNNNDNYEKNRRKQHE